MKKTKLINVCAVLAVFMVMFYGFFSANSDDKPTTASNFNLLGTPNAVVNNGGPTGDLVGSWALGANVLNSRYEGTGAFYQNGTTGYLFFEGGDLDGSGTLAAYNDRYTVGSNTWTRMAPEPTPVWYNAGAVAGGFLYLVGGMTNLNFSSAIATVQKYDIAGNTWTTATSLPAPTAWNRVVTYQDTVIYSLGGFTGGGSTGGSQVYVYNTVSNTWRTGTSLPAPNCGFGAAISGDTIMVACGGTGYVTGTTKNVWRGVINAANHSTITWTAGTVYPGQSTQRLGACPWYCKGIIMAPGSASGFGFNTECFVYFNNTWTAQPNALNATSAAAYGSFNFNNIGKYVVASGLILSPPYSIPQTQIYTDTVCYGAPLAPLCEGFTSTTFPPTGWTFGATGGSFWFRNTVSGFNLGTGSAYYDMWNAPTGTTQDLISPTFVPSAAGDSIKFDIAFCPFGTSPDQLQISASTNGGTSYTIVHTLTYSEMQTVSSCSHPFTPSAASDWGRRGYPVPTGTNKMKFTGISGFGDGFFIDSLCVVHPVGVANNQNGVPRVYSLSQNYPNPFNPSTSISFAIPKAGNVELKVYDLLGKEVATLVNEFKPVGNYTITFNANSYASGVYFYKIKAGDFVTTKKMLLVK